MSELRQMALRNNLLTGSLPAEWSGFTQLWYL
jgi:hypothetical protein